MSTGPPPIDDGLVRRLIALPHYRSTNPAMARNARHVIRTVLEEG